jgi:hypothetical protein
MIRRCTHCGVILKDRYKIKFCSNKCQCDYQYNLFINNWKLKARVGNVGVTTSAMSAHIRRYLLCKNDMAGCSLCGWNKVHSITKRIPLEIDHIDGNAENNSEENLRLICPNCHSLTPHFRNLNKGKGRKWRTNKYKKN